ncbi:hypothetical protein glysoja_028278 [Glycine soja]|uniref:Uncharacterized protein n=2 Tax=Glycine subgen. Soja TaxID=1462606 RepID=K7MQ90_SOYBN|nr:hypothetical protein glysoja_028278 [Glycine soja]
MFCHCSEPYFLLNKILFYLGLLHTDDEASSMVGRSLKVINLQDYGEPTANHGHDPWKGASWGGNGGRKG